MHALSALRPGFCWVRPNLSLELVVLGRGIGLDANSLRCVANRPRLGGYSQVRTLVHSYIRMPQLEGYSWTG
jgi:hypothetical protein